eukprot:377399_1
MGCLFGKKKEEEKSPLLSNPSQIETESQRTSSAFDVYSNSNDQAAQHLPSRSTHHDEELGLMHYVSMHHIPGKQSQGKLFNNGVEVESTRPTGQQREIMLNYG